MYVMQCNGLTAHTLTLILIIIVRYLATSLWVCIVYHGSVSVRSIVLNLYFMRFYFGTVLVV